MKTITKSLLLGFAFVFAACESSNKPKEYAFSEPREIEGVMIEASDKAFDGEIVMPGLSPALQTAGDTTYFVYGHFDQYYPLTISGVSLSYLDTVRVLARTAEAKDYHKSTYYCVDIVEVLEVKPTSIAID